MVNRKYLGLIIAIVLIISALSLVYAREYSIDNAYLNLTINDNGLLHVEEEYDYSFIGTFNGVTRDIPLKTGESIENLSINIDGGYGTYTKRIENGELKLKIYLYSDALHTKKISDTNVKVKIKYDMSNVVTVYKDTVSLQYKIWGDEWETSVGKLTTNINLPSSTGNMYWLNPSQYNLTSSVSGNTIHSVSTKIPKGNYYELQVLMPTEDFDNAIYTKHEDINAKDKIIKIQEDHKAQETFNNNLYFYLGCLFAINPLVLGGIYLKYGREPKIEYEALYEREIPTKDPPAKVNALIDEKGGQYPNMRGFEATIMDLINRGEIKIETTGEEIKTLVLDFSKTNKVNLDTSETILIDTLKSFSINNKLNLEDLRQKLHVYGDAEYFRERYYQWGEECKNQYLDDNKIKEYTNTKGAKIGKILGIIGIILGVILIAICFNSNLENAKFGLIGGAIIIITGIISVLLPKDILGQWSPYGKEYHDKWENFKKFLKDNSLINQHPPESIIIWNQYLVYGTALGVADKVYESMKLHVPSERIDNDLYIFHSYNGLYMMHSAFNTGLSTGNNDSSSGLGGVGGGSGGGGGGAF